MTTRRVTSASVADVRLWLGVGLVAGAMALGALVMRSGADTVTVMRATRDLAVGASPADLERVQVERDLVGTAYVGVDVPVDAVLTAPVRAGELVPLGAIATGEVSDVRAVTVPVEPLHAPAELHAGDRVDVWASAGSSTSDREEPHLVLASATVRSMSADSGVSGDLGVVLEVPAEEVAAVVAATRGGVIDLVSVPVSVTPA